MTEVIPEVSAAVAETTAMKAPANGSAPADASKGAESDEQNSVLGLAVLFGLLGWLWIAAGWEFVVVVLTLVFMITMHELGHYLAARRGGMKVTEFFLGFGPRLWSFRRGETEYGVKGIWAGAYVKVIGMNNLEEVEPGDEPSTYRQQSYPRRLLVAVAGSAMHFLMAIIAIYIVTVSSGLYTDDTQWTVSDVPVTGAAFGIGIQDGDRVISADGVAFDSFEEMRTFVEARPAGEATFEVLRDGEIVSLTGVIGVNDQTGTGRLGVATSPGDLPRIDEGPVSAVPETFRFFGIAIKDTTVAIVDIFSPSGLVDFFGRVNDTADAPITDDPTIEAPVEDNNDGRILSLIGATQLGAELTSSGFIGLLVFFLSINIFVGVINLAPLLPLDGGHVVIATYERLRSRNGVRYHADVAKALPLAYAVMLLLLVVGVVAIYLDIADPLSF